MTSLSGEQKQLLFDYCIGLTSEEEAAQAQSLISSNKEAAEIHAKLKSAFAPLESIKSEPCPDDLVESTIQRLNAARATQVKLQQLLATEQGRELAAASPFWPRLGKVLASAAVFIIGLSILLSSLGYARNRASQQQCAMNLSRIFGGLTQYASEHDGELPAVAAAAGEPWWKVGDQGRENHSNTRALWLLVQLNYNKAPDFVCSGSSRGKPLQLDTSHLSQYHDFPGREYITYSFQIGCRQADSGKLICRRVLVADLSPLFESLPDDYSKSLRLTLNKELLTRNSINHKRRGQNVLYGDGRAEFIRTRHAGILEDDIYTLQNVDIYEGREVPTCETDFFLAP